MYVCNNGICVYQWGEILIEVKAVQNVFIKTICPWKRKNPLEKRSRKLKFEIPKEDKRAKKIGENVLKGHHQPSSLLFSEDTHFEKAGRRNIKKESYLNQWKKGQSLSNGVFISTFHRIEMSLMLHVNIERAVQCLHISLRVMFQGWTLLARFVLSMFSRN